MHVPGGIRTRNPRKRESADPILRPRGHWDRPYPFLIIFLFLMYSFNIKYSSNFTLSFTHQMKFIGGPGSSVGIATHYGLDGPGSNACGDENLRTCSGRPWGPPSLLYNGYRVFPGVKRGRGVLLTTHSLLVPRSWKSRTIPLPTLKATPGL